MSEPVPLEASESREVIQYCKRHGYRVTHVKNETGRPMRGRRVRNYKAMWDAIDGVSPGFPDLVIALPNAVVFIEMKRIKGSKTSMEQLKWITALKAAGAHAEICLGAKEAIAFIRGVRALSE